MRCEKCSHDNPNENRYCGICGNPLTTPPVGEHALEMIAFKAPWEPATSRRQESSPLAAPEKMEPQRPQEIEPRPVETRHEAVTPPSPPPDSPRRNDKWWVDERETTVGGPSFLGLSSADSENGGGYSYLFQDEQEGSHKALWVLLLLLLVLGGAVYAKWQPIRDYVLTTAIAHSRPKPPAAQQATAPSESAQPAQNAPTTTLASSDAQGPAITTENKPPANPPAAANAKEGLPEGDKAATAAADKTGASAGANKGSSPETGAEPASKPPEPKARPSSKDVTSANEAGEDAAAADDEKPSAAAAAKKSRAPQATDGGELVSSGERYLYGRGVARNCNQAVSYFNAAAAQQNPQAFSHLGALYATGECVPMDRAMAYAWFRRAYAKEPSNHYFEQNLTMLWREMTPAEKQRATGRQ